MNAHFKPATESKVLAGSYIVWVESQTMYYANGSGRTSELRYRLDLVAKKQKDILVTKRFSRVPLYKAYVVTPELAAKWPTWTGDDACLGNKKITKDELVNLLETM